MPDHSSIAFDLLSQGKLQEALHFARQVVRVTPSDWHARYVLGQCLLKSNDLRGAIDQLSEANRMSPKNPGVLLALGVAQQLTGAYNAAIGSLSEALGVDPDFVPALSSLAMTQKLIGDFARADHNYDLVLKSLSRTIVKDMRNSAENVRLPHGESRNHLWVKYLFDAALWHAVNDGMDSIAMPTGDTAIRDAQTGFLKGWYWNDDLDKEGKRIRSFYPNFFNTFRDRLIKERTYRELIADRGAVLEKMDRKQEAKAYYEEAMDFA